MRWFFLQIQKYNIAIVKKHFFKNYTSAVRTYGVTWPVHRPVNLACYEYTEEETYIILYLYLIYLYFLQVNQVKIVTTYSTENKCKQTKAKIISSNFSGWDLTRITICALLTIQSKYLQVATVLYQNFRNIAFILEETIVETRNAASSVTVSSSWISGKINCSAVLTIKTRESRDPAATELS